MTLYEDDMNCCPLGYFWEMVLSIFCLYIFEVLRVLIFNGMHFSFLIRMSNCTNRFRRTRGLIYFQNIHVCESQCISKL